MGLVFSCVIINMKIQIFWSGGCSTCKTLYNKVVEIVEQIDTSIKVEHIEDITKLIELWVMSSPAFVVDWQVIVAWKVPNEKEIKEIILETIK